MVRKGVWKGEAVKEDPLDAVVTFVKWEGDIIAFFRAYRSAGEKDFTKTKPELKSRHRPEIAYWALEGYVHNGQHGCFDEEILRHCIKCGYVATPDEYAPLKKELEGLFAYVVYPHQHGRLKLRGKWYDRKETKRCKTR